MPGNAGPDTETVQWILGQVCAGDLSYLHLSAWLWQWFTQGDNILNVVPWKSADVKCLPSQHRTKLKPLWSSHRQEIQQVCNLRKERGKVQLSQEEKWGLFTCFWKINKLFLPVILLIWRAGLLEAFKLPQIHGSVGQKAPYGALWFKLQLKVCLSPALHEFMALYNTSKYREAHRMEILQPQWILCFGAVQSP